MNVYDAKAMTSPTTQARGVPEVSARGRASCRNGKREAPSAIWRIGCFAELPAYYAHPSWWPQSATTMTVDSALDVVSISRHLLASLPPWPHPQPFPSADNVRAGLVACTDWHIVARLAAAIEIIVLASYSDGAKCEGMPIGRRGDDFDMSRRQSLSQAAPSALSAEEMQLIRRVAPLLIPSRPLWAFETSCREQGQVTPSLADMSAAGVGSGSAIVTRYYQTLEPALGARLRLLLPRDALIGDVSLKFEDNADAFRAFVERVWMWGERQCLW